MPTVGGRSIYGWAYTLVAVVECLLDSHNEPESWCTRYLSIMTNSAVTSGSVTSGTQVEGGNESTRQQSGVHAVVGDDLAERLRDSRKEVHHLVNVISAVRGLLQLAERAHAAGDHEGAWKYVERATTRTAG